LIIVPVFVNGKGPYDFLLDTGSSATTIDRDLAAEVGLSMSGRTTILSIQGGETTILTAKANTVSLGEAAVSQLTVGVVKTLASAPVKARGVLGEDFLSNFDLLLDYQHRYIQFDPRGGSLAETLAGEHIPLRLVGNDRLGPINNRLIVVARLPELISNSVTLLLDSGANVAVLFGPLLHLSSIRGSSVYAYGNSVSSPSIIAGNWEAIGQIVIGETTAISLSTLVMGTQIAWDVDGLLPTSAFHSIFISHSGKFVIFNPHLISSLTQIPPH